MSTIVTTEDHGDVEITAQCLCRANTFTTTVPRSALPLLATACHCDSCRHSTGAMYSIDTLWPGDRDAVARSALKKYNFSEKIKILFCATCSSPMFWEQPVRLNGMDHLKDREYGLFTGVLNDGPETLVKVTDHIFVGDTLDGGATVWLRHPNGDGVEAKRWFGRVDKSRELPRHWPEKTTLPTVEWRNDKQDLSIQCHCKGVDFVYRSSQALKENMTKQTAQLSRYVDPISRKPVAGIDACNSCRTSCGVDFSYWTFASLRHIGFPAHGSHTQGLSGFAATMDDLYTAVSAAPDVRDPRLGTLAVYSSSDGVKRYFCSQCSACVFYAADKRHDMVNVAMGLFDAPEGARADGMFRWLLGGLVKHGDDVVDSWRGKWLEAIEAGSEAWRVERNYPKW